MKKLKFELGVIISVGQSYWGCREEFHHFSIYSWPNQKQACLIDKPWFMWDPLTL